MPDPETRHVLVARPSNRQGITLSLVVPAYNEAFRIPALLADLQASVDPETTEVLVVDDGSTDGTAEAVQRAGGWAPHLKVLTLESNQGKGAAVRAGVAEAVGSVIGFLDADNATDLAALPSMVEQLSGTVGAVFGSRHAPGSVVTGSPAIRGVMGRVFNHVVRFAAGTAISDTQCGAKVFTGPAARLAFGVSQIDGFAFDVELLRTLTQLGFEVREHPVTWHYVPGTKIKTLTPVAMLRDIARVRMNRAPMSVVHVDTNWSEAVATAADPLDGAATLRPGDSCRVLLPGRDIGEAEQLAARLRQAGLWCDVGQSRTWLQPIGRSAS